MLVLCEDSSTMNTPFEIGDTYWAPRTSSEKVRLPCPVCNGTGIVIVLYGGEERVAVDCEGCGLGFDLDHARGYVDEWEFEPAAELFVIAEVVSLYNGRWSVRSTTGATNDFDALLKTEHEALVVSKTRCIEQHERNMQSRQHKRGSAKRATWTAIYHKNCIKDLERQIAWHTARVNAKNKKEQ
jgi:hypothetical protein